MTSRDQIPQLGALNDDSMIRKGLLIKPQNEPYDMISYD